MAQNDMENEPVSICLTQGKFHFMVSEITQAEIDKMNEIKQRNPQKDRSFNKMKLLMKAIKELNNEQQAD